MKPVLGSLERFENHCSPFTLVGRCWQKALGPCIFAQANVTMHLSAPCDGITKPQAYRPGDDPFTGKNTDQVTMEAAAGI
ncbi:hypothetical protein PCANC_24219 [Puccinia coronata f. sp. avenae]|uniref:Uncharacterized protein n=1 Tax=Puccinia coronata f. sp. avenae TaxID=200324 RepID=A0A2N5S3K2_9BASI|nr:hypothetical protein PCANC_24219 [Puccinia coronata f. sp. avenae]